MSKAKLYKASKNNSKFNFNKDLLEFIVGIVVYAVVLMLASTLFRNMYVESFIWAIVAALILSLLNYSIKPILIYWTLPLNIVTFGISYPIVNLILLKLCDLIMGEVFTISGFITAFIIAIFISIMKIILDNLITKNIGRG